MAQQYDVAVLGATGLVGQHLIEILEQRDFPVNKLYPLASSRSAGGMSPLRVNKSKYWMLRPLTGLRCK